MIEEILKPGLRLGGFDLLAPIGRGGMASVWVARGSALGAGAAQHFAIKIMLPELSGEMDFRDLFLAEGRLIRSIQHPHVVRVYDVGVEDSLLYIAMEWVEGASLHSLIAEANKRSPIPTEMAVRLIADTAAGLHAAHEARDEHGNVRGVVHCDVSPHNILVGLKRGVKLVDFGVAATLNSMSGGSSPIRGKFSYMSPEQTRGETLDRRSDVFSLGIVLFELTTGYRLFRGQTPQQAIDLVRNGPITDPRQLREDYPAALAEIVMRALRRDPEERFPTAAGLRSALETFLHTQRIVVPSAGINALLERVLGDKILAQRAAIDAAERELFGSGVNTPPPRLETPYAATDDDTASALSRTSSHPPVKRHRPWVLATALGLAAGGVGAWTLARQESPLAVNVEPGADKSKPAELTAAKAKRSADGSEGEQSVSESALRGAPEPAASSTRAFTLSALPKAQSTDGPGPEGSASGVQAQATSAPAGGSDAQRLASAVRAVRACGRQGGPKGKGAARLSVASGGTIVAVGLSAPFNTGTNASCIAGKFRGLRLRPGKPRTLVRKFTVR